MANYIEELDQLAAQNESNPGGPFDTQPIEGQILAGARVAPVQQPAAAPYIGYGDPSTEGLPRMMSTDRVAFDPALAVQQGAQQMAGTPTPAQQAAPVAQGAAPAEERAPRQRGGVTWSAPGTTEAFTQEDFYPNPQDPAQYGYSTGLEVVARPGRMPMGAISKAANILNNRQVELDQKRQAFAAEFSKVPKTADPYQQNFTRLVQERNNEFVQGIADAMYGGNVNKAYRAIATNPELQARWRDMNAKNEALAAHGLYNFKRAEDYLTKAAENKIDSTPEMRQLAKDIIYGSGRYKLDGSVGGNFDKLVNDMTKFDMMLGRDEYFRTTIAPSVKDFAEKLALGVDEKGNPLMKVQNGRYVFLTTGSRKQYDAQIDEISTNMAIKGYGMGDSIAEREADNKKFLTAMLRPQVDLETKAIDTYAGAGGGDGGGQKPAWGGAYQKITPKGPEYANYLKFARDAGVKMPSNVSAIDSYNLIQKTAEKGKLPNPVQIGTDVYYPLDIIRGSDRKLWVHVKDSKMTGEQAIKQEEAKKANRPMTLSAQERPSVQKPDGEVDVAVFNQLKDDFLPWDEYKNVIMNLYPGLTEKGIHQSMDQGWSELIGGMKQQQASETPPEPGAIRIDGYDGWWKEENGQVVKVK